MRAMAANGSGGGPPPEAGQPPDTYPGLTFWFGGDESVMYTNTGASNVTSTTDGVEPRRIDSAGGISRSLGNNASNFGVYANPIVGSARGVKRTPTYQNVAYFGAKPSGSNNVTSLHNMTTYVTTSVKRLVVLVKVDDAAADVGYAYGNHAVISDTAGYCGLHFYKSGSNVVFQWYNWSGGEVRVEITVPLGEWCVLECKHQGGQIAMRKNGGSWVTAASGTTDTLGSVAQFLAGSGADSNLSVPQFALYNANRADAETLEVARFMGAKAEFTF